MAWQRERDRDVLRILREDVRLMMPEDEPADDFAGREMTGTAR
jgi:hypothetical protein